MRTIKPLPKVIRCFHCEGRTEVWWCVGIENEMWVKCTNPECQAAGPRRKTERGAITSWNRIADKFLR